MQNHLVQLPWGTGELDVQIPENWHLAGVLAPSSLPVLADVEAATARGLADPIGTGRISQRVNAETKIALVIDDDSRPTPVAAIVPALFKELQAGGARLDQVTVIPGLGVHRAMRESEMAARVGEEWFTQINWTMHDCDDKEKLSYLGETSRGTPVWVNKMVAESDLIISVGCIEPHIIASFGGGYKNLIPGVAARKTIAHNHGLNTTPDTFNNVGQPIEKNPMRLDLEEGAQMLEPPVFIINAVLNSALQPVEIVCGDPIEAHRAGTKTSAQVYGVQVPAMPDVLITASYPMDQDLRQGVKALANNVRAVRKGGVMITAIRADEGEGVFGLANRKLPVGRGMLRLLAPLLLPNIGRLPLSGMGEEDRFFLYFALQAMRHAELLVYAPNIPEEIHERLPFVTFVESMEAAVAMAQKKFPRNAVVVVIPNGGSSYPVLPG